MRGLAYRRHQKDRIKNRIKRFLCWYYKPGLANPQVIGLWSTTRALCSCWMCGNPRKFIGEYTRQEMKADKAIPLREKY
jgi:hypothetical protein